MSSTARTSKDVEFIRTCKNCFSDRPLTQKMNNVELAISHEPSPSALPLDSRSETKLDVSDSSLATKSKKRLCNLGLIWRKKNVEGTGLEFKHKNIIPQGNPNKFDVSVLICHLCRKGYDPHLTFIRCDTCSAWYHTDALELDESKLPELHGFKCCRFRRIRSPVCPYKEEKIAADSVSAVISDRTESSLPTGPISVDKDVFVQVNDPLPLSASSVEPIPQPLTDVDYGWNVPSGPRAQKLPGRRHLKR